MIRPWSGLIIALSEDWASRRRGRRHGRLHWRAARSAVHARQPQRGRGRLDRAVRVRPPQQKMNALKPA